MALAWRNCEPGPTHWLWLGPAWLWLKPGLFGQKQQFLSKGILHLVQFVAFSPDCENIVAGSDDRRVWIWDAEGKALGEPFQGHTDSVLPVASSSDSKHIASGSSDDAISVPFSPKPEAVMWNHRSKHAHIASCLSHSHPMASI